MWAAHSAAIAVFAHETGKRADAAHDMAHLARVVRTAQRLAADEGASLDVVLPAAWLHDCVHVRIGSPDRPRASVMAADVAVEFLAGIGYPVTFFEAIHHAIAAHSFSARITPDTTEARVVQDADRLDAMGAIGIARTMMLAGELGRILYDVEDPFAERRTPDDRVATIDHFYTKLLVIPDTMQTASGRREATRRKAYLLGYLEQLRSEI